MYSLFTCTCVLTLDPCILFTLDLCLSLHAHVQSLGRAAVVNDITEGIIHICCNDQQWAVCPQQADDIG